MNASEYYQKLSAILDNNWNVLIQTHGGNLTNGGRSALYTYLQTNRNQILAELINLQQQYNGQPIPQQAFNAIVEKWFSIARSNVLGQYPQIPNYPVQQQFIPYQQNMVLRQNNSPYVIQQQPQQSPYVIGQQMQFQTMPDTMTAMADLYETTPTVSKKWPSAPLSVVKPSVSKIPSIMQSVSEIKNIKKTVNNFEFPKPEDQSEITIKTPVKAQGDIKVYVLNNGKKSKKLYLNLVDPVDDIESVFSKIKKKYDYDQIILKYKSYELVKTSDFTELKHVFDDIKGFIHADGATNETILKEIIDCLKMKTVGIADQVSDIILDEYNAATTHFGTTKEVPIITKLKDINLDSCYGERYFMAALNMICDTNIVSVADSKMASFIGSYDSGKDGKTVNELKKCKQKFSEWAKENAIVISHQKLIRFTKLADSNSSEAESLILDGTFEQVEYDGTDVDSNFEYFLDDDIKIDSTRETLLVQGRFSIHKLNIARMTYTNGSSTIKSIVLYTE